MRHNRLRPSEQWRTPDRDASRYMDSLLDYVGVDVQLNGTLRSDYCLPDFDDLDDQDINELWRNGTRLDDDIASRPTNGGGNPYRMARGATEFIEELDWEYETSVYSGDERSEFEDLIEAARDAIERGDIEDLYSLLDELSTIRADLDVEKLEHWIDLLPIKGKRRAVNHKETGKSLVNKVHGIIRSVCEKLCELIARNPRALDHIEWRQLELLIGEALRGLGFEVEVTEPSKDGGKDVVAHCQAHGHRETYFIEIKHWRSGKLVKSKPIFNFIEVNARGTTNGGLFLSTSGFSDDVYRHLAEICRQKVWLGGEWKVVSLCQHFSQKRQGLWRPVTPLPNILFAETIASPDHTKKHS